MPSSGVAKHWWVYSDPAPAQWSKVKEFTIEVSNRLRCYAIQFCCERHHHHCLILCFEEPLVKAQHCYRPSACECCWKLNTAASHSMGHCSARHAGMVHSRPWGTQVVGHTIVTSPLSSFHGDCCTGIHKSHSETFYYIPNDYIYTNDVIGTDLKFQQPKWHQWPIYSNFHMPIIGPTSEVIN